MLPTMYRKWAFPAGAFPRFCAVVVALQVKYFADGAPVVWWLVSDAKLKELMGGKCASDAPSVS